jgi:hypothetical protein
MNKFTRYSPSKNGFYPYTENYSDLPDDLIDIGEIEFIELRDLQKIGHVIEPDENGIPLAKKTDLLTKDQLRNLLSIPKLQFCLNLDKYRLLDIAFAYIDTLPRSNLFRLTWECNGAISYSDPNVQELLHTTLNLDTVMSDDMFM